MVQILKPILHQNVGTWKSACAVGLALQTGQSTPSVAECMFMLHFGANVKLKVICDNRGKKWRVEKARFVASKKVCENWWMRKYCRDALWCTLRVQKMKMGDSDFQFHEWEIKTFLRHDMASQNSSSNWASLGLVTISEIFHRVCSCSGAHWLSSNCFNARIPVSSNYFKSSNFGRLLEKGQSCHADCASGARCGRSGCKMWPILGPLCTFPPWKGGQPLPADSRMHHTRRRRRHMLGIAPSLRRAAVLEFCRACEFHLFLHTSNQLSVLGLGFCAICFKKNLGKNNMSPKERFRITWWGSQN